MPGMVAFFIPLVVLRPGSVAFFMAPSIVPLGLGVTVLLWCVREFYVAGNGTLAPWAPPVHLVASGPYRCSRNPMYLAVLLILIGWALGFRSGPLVAYLIALMALFHLRVIWYEEPFLERAHGEAWRRYRARVPRWLGIGQSA